MGKFHWTHLFIMGIIWGLLLILGYGVEFQKNGWNPNNDWLYISGIIIISISVVIMAIFKPKTYKPRTTPSTGFYQTFDVSRDSNPTLPKGYQQQNPSVVYDGNLLESDLNDNFRRLSWENAEDLVGTLFEKKGYSTTVTQRSGDFGIDVEAKTDREYIGIQVKHWNGYVDFDTVAKTLGVQNKYNRVIIVSTKSGFSSHALTWANRDENKYRIELWDTNKFKNELRQYVLR